MGTLQENPIPLGGMYLSSAGQSLLGPPLEVHLSVCTSPGQKMREIPEQGDLQKGRKMGVHFGVSSNLEARVENSHGDISCSL